MIYQEPIVQKVLYPYVHIKLFRYADSLMYFTIRVFIDVLEIRFAIRSPTEGRVISDTHY